MTRTVSAMDVRWLECLFNEARDIFDRYSKKTSIPFDNQMSSELTKILAYRQTLVNTFHSEYKEKPRLRKPQCNPDDENFCSATHNIECECECNCLCVCNTSECIGCACVCTRCTMCFRIEFDLINGMCDKCRMLP